MKKLVYHLLHIVVGLCITIPAAPAIAEAMENKPNIIYILADDLGYGDLSCYGQEKFQTPNIDRLAQEGVLFTQHYSGSTVCAPTRCSLMTGLHTGHSQVRGNQEVKPEGQAPMLEGTVTIPTLLKKAGYVSGAFGKWGLGFPGSASDPMVFFDTFYGYNCQRRAHSFYPGHLWSNDQKVLLDGKTYSHDLIMENALTFVRANKDDPFFCYLAVSIPHAAMQAPEELHQKYRELYPKFENSIGRYGASQVQNPVAAFPAMVEHLDNGVGALMELLKELEIDDNTIVIFSSDNGPHKEGGHKPEFWNSNGPLKGIKRDLTEGGIRVPFIARWPGKIEPGTTSHHISAHWDMMSTFCELAGVKPTADTDGISMLPELLGKEQLEHKYLYWEFSRKKGGASAKAVRMGKFKALKTNGQATQLFNLENDIGENKDIAADFPEIVQQIEKIFVEAHTEPLTLTQIK
ncbi:MAG: arylsulfatase [Verrucomicrobiota bacterium]